jgi:hypothetical protein
MSISDINFRSAGAISDDKGASGFFVIFGFIFD